MSEVDVKEWLTLASHDADTAALLIKEKGHADIIIYHVHQAIEKLLKALIVKSNKTITKTHFLDKLLAQLLKDYPALAKVEGEILEINLYLPKLRYPSGDRIDFEEAMDIYNKYLKISQLIHKVL